MRKTVFSLVTCALWLSSCDPSIGTEECIGTACTKPLGLQPTLLNVTFQKVSVESPADLPIKWRMPRPCTGPCMPPSPISLSRGMGDTVWTEPRDGTLRAIDLIDAAGLVTRTTISPPTVDVAGLLGSYLSADIEGRAVVHLQWGGPEMEPVDQVSLVQPPNQIVGITLSSPAKLPPPLALIASQAGFLMFEGDERGQIVRLVDFTGKTSWQQTKFPKFASSVGTSAAFANDRFVLSASDGDPKDTHYGLLSLDTSGAVTKFEINSDSRWTSATMLQLDQGAFAVAAASNLLVERFVNDGAGNIDVVMFAANGQLTGYRMERVCFLDLTVFGFTYDAAGSLYISSVVGTKTEPRGLLCRLSPSASRCFQAEPQVLLGQIAATNAGVIFAAAGDEILRIELPP